MPRNRVYIPDPMEPGRSLRLDDERAHYLGRVLRLKVGDGLTVFNGDGGEFSAVVTEMSRKGAFLRVEEFRQRSAESPLQVRLIQGVSKGERMDFVVQKATELGVHRISPAMTAFSVVRLNGDRGDRREKRALHWTKVARSACEQCGRNLVPLIDAPLPLTAWLEEPPAAKTARVVLHPGAQRPLAALQEIGERVELLIGPEGGLSDTEYEAALAGGYEGCSLGPRVLRTETAAIVALAILQSRFGDLRPPPP